MKILVGIKRVIDYQAVIRLTPDQSAVDKTNVKMAINPFDEIAVEEAVRLKEKGIASEVIVVAIGLEACQESLRRTLAMGVDRAVLVKTELTLAPLNIAKILHALVEAHASEFVILGKQAIDTDDNQVGQMLSGLLNWPQGTFASAIEFEENYVLVTREIDGGSETLKLTLPALITADLRLNEPRYLSLPHIVQAKNKPLVVMSLDDFKIDAAQHVAIKSLSEPSKTRGSKKLTDVASLVDVIKKARASL